MRIHFTHVPEIAVWDALCATEPEIESLALGSTSNTSEQKKSKSKKKDEGEDDEPPIYLPVEIFERESYPGIAEIQEQAKKIPGLWEKLHTKITSDDIPRVLSTWPWPIVNEIAVEMMTKTTFDIVNFALEKTQPSFAGKGLVTIAGGDAFKGVRNRAAAPQSHSKDAEIEAIGTGDRERFAVKVDKPKVVTIIPDRGAGFVTFYSEERPSKRIALSKATPRQVSTHKFNPNVKPPARFAQFHHPTCLKNKNVLPGEIKVCFKFQLEDITSVTEDNKLLESRVKQAEKVFTQVHKYMNENDSLWGYVVTDYELIVVRRTPEYGHIKVSQSIPLSASAGQLNAKIALWWLHYRVAFHVPQNENDKGAFLPKSPIPDTFEDLVEDIRKARNSRKYSVEQGSDGYDILQFLPPLQRLTIGTNEPEPEPQLDKSSAILDRESQPLEPLVTRKRPSAVSDLDEGYYDDFFESGPASDDELRSEDDVAQPGTFVQMF